MAQNSPTPKSDQEVKKGSLMWDCFLNWSATLEKIDKGLIRPKAGQNQ